MRRKQTATTKHTASQQQAPCFQRKTEKKGEKTELNFQQGETYSNMPVAGTERKGYVSLGLAKEGAAETVAAPECFYKNSDQAGI